MICGLMPRPHLHTMSADSLRARSADSVRGLFAYRSHTVLCVHTCLACLVNHAISSNEVAAGVCAGYMSIMRRKKRPKHAKRFWTRRLFSPLGFLEDPVFLDPTTFYALSETDFDIADFFLSTSVVPISYFLAIKSIPSLFYYGCCSRHNAHPVNMH
jgi:hypothetical protein